MFVNIIVAYNKNKGIGLNNTLPWKISSDLKKFKKLTTGLNNNNAVIMGKNTWLSLNNKSLKFRDNLILSSSLKIDKKDNNNNIIKSFENEVILKNFLIEKNYEEIWVIGGAKIYDLFLNKSNIFTVEYIYITLVDINIECDTFFPEINENKYCFKSKSIHNINNNINNIDDIDIIYDIIYKNIN
tara:strand:- start:2601 stop:3155 length:555 start_codon:yes stop_codon:yes gene_type:complete